MMNVAVIDIHAVINTGAVERNFKKSFIKIYLVV